MTYPASRACRVKLGGASQIAVQLWLMAERFPPSLLIPACHVSLVPRPDSFSSVLLLARHNEQAECLKFSSLLLHIMILLNTISMSLLLIFLLLFLLFLLAPVPVPNLYLAPLAPLPRTLSFLPPHCP
eukprot:445874-Hanusia_phi.AAC.1